MTIELFNVELWVLFPAFLGIFGSIAGIFAAGAEKSAAKKALAILNQARLEGTARAKEIEKEFDPFIGTAKEQLEMVFDAATGGFKLAEAGFAAGGLTEADRISFEDAVRLMNENLVTTGNLRSGAAGLANAEVTRRVTADAITRRLQFGELALGFGGLLQNIGATTGQIGLGGLQLATGLRETVLGLAPAEASAELQLGRAKAAEIQAFGGLGTSLLGAGLGFAGAGGLPPGFSSAAIGSSIGPSGFGQMALLQKLFGGGGGGGGGGIQRPLLSNQAFNAQALNAPGTF